MPNVVAFRLTQRRKAAVDDDGVRGRILWFTGVRYFRFDEADTPYETDPAPGDVHRADDETAAERLKA